KRSLLRKMPGDEWQQLANLRALYGYMFGQPGKQLLFMGAELAQRTEWNHDHELPWQLLDDEGHLGVQRWVAHLNHLHRTEPALHERDFTPDGFSWVDAADATQSVVAFQRWPASADAPGTRDRPVLVVCNFTPVPRQPYRVGVPVAGRWE